jgi:hypothetical protein
VALPNQVPPPFGNLPFINPTGGFLSIPALQFLTQLQASSPLAACAFAALPTKPIAGRRGYITDSTLVAVGNFGVAAASGGTHGVPVWWSGETNSWRIG